MEKKAWRWGPVAEGSSPPGGPWSPLGAVTRSTRSSASSCSSSAGEGSGGSPWSCGSGRSQGAGTGTDGVAQRLDFSEVTVPRRGATVAESQPALLAPGCPDLGRPLLGGDGAVAAKGTATAVGEGGRVFWESFFVVLPVFCAYAALFGLQHKIKLRLRIPDDDSPASHDFSFATSFLYMFNLVFRFGHSIAFGCIGRRERVFLAMLSMTASMLILAVPIMIEECYQFSWVALAYALGGMAVGCFESNFLSCLTPFGPRTKHVAITAIPVGTTLVLVGGFLLMGPPLHVPVAAIYGAAAILLLGGMVVMAWRIPPGALSSEAADAAQLANVRQQPSGSSALPSDARRYREWLPQLWHYPLAYTLDQVALTAFTPGVMLFMYNGERTAVAEGVWWPTTSFFAVFNAFGMLGGLTGRFLSYRVGPRHPIAYVMFTAAGVALILRQVPALAPVGAYLVLLGDGLIYGTISRHIDATIPHRFNLTAISYWLFIGDLGSVAGSNLISYIRDWAVGA